MDIYMKKICRFGLVCTALAFFLSCSAEKKVILNYEDCVDAGNVILRSLPPQCVTRDGHRFVKEEQTKRVIERAQQFKACEQDCSDTACDCGADSNESCSQACKK
jgi:hypothetical protein